MLQAGLIGAEVSIGDHDVNGLDGLPAELDCYIKFRPASSFADQFGEEKRGEDKRREERSWGRLGVRRLQPPPPSTNPSSRIDKKHVKSIDVKSRVGLRRLASPLSRLTFTAHTHTLGTSLGGL